MFKLEKQDYRKVIPLFTEVYLDFVIQAVVKGNQRAQIWVDSENPQSAFMWNQSSCYYLVGTESNHEFNEAIRSLLSDTIILKGVDSSVFKVHYTKGWEKEIHGIFRRPLVKRERQLYTFDHLKIDWKNKVPPRSSVKFITGELLEANLENTTHVIAEIKSMWPSLDQFLVNGFGFCSVLCDEIVCWCTAEYVSDTICGIGIETLEEYENRGYATVTASAFVEHCISKGISPVWDCWSHNIPSIRVAEKVGFKKAADFAVYFGSYSEY